MALTPAFVLDSWAVLAWLKLEFPAAQRVRSLFESAGRRETGLAMSIVNVGEVYYRSVKNRDLKYAGKVLTLLRSTVTSISAGDDLVMHAARLKARYPISYADAFAAATAIAQNMPLVSGDADFRLLEAKEKGFYLEWIGGE